MFWYNDLNILATPLCNISLPQYEEIGGVCSLRRLEQIERARQYYRLTTAKTPDEPNPRHDLLAPILDQTSTAIIMRITFHKEDAAWATIYSAMNRVIDQTADKLLAKLGENTVMSSYEQYEMIYKDFMKSLQVGYITNSIIFFN